MNEYEYLRLTNGIDERFAAEYESLRPGKPISVKRSVKIAVGIAAAAAFVIPVGAYAYSTFMHKENVQHIIKSADELESRGIVANETTDDGELRFTVETVMYDGCQLYGVLTVESMNESGMKYMSPGRLGYDITAVYADNGEFITNDCNTSVIYDGTEKYGENRQPILINTTGVDMSRGIRLLFHKRGPTDNYYGKGTLTGQRDNNEVPIRFDCETIIPTEKNIKSAELKSADGKSIVLSEYELYCEPAAWKAADRGISKDPDILFIGADGGKTPLESYYNLCYMEDYSYITFNELLDVDDYRGVEINGIEYLK
ncbi:hypothetical protein [Ruminococcus sp. YE78]|uniref:hypothetical protein n=1 Tax=Ruminococcus sp. YE78 TaxID=1352374 RepID=UPI00088199DD|nr:hypothetical protein [Ruminococcus sp. YE78]SDA28079.1 hypothetical protein SAMN02910446_02910 [Ruminococcus sp. YE78]